MSVLLTKSLRWLAYALATLVAVVLLAWGSQVIENPAIHTSTWQPDTAFQAHFPESDLSHQEPNFYDSAAL